MKRRRTMILPSSHSIPWSESGNEGGFERTSKGLDFHESGKLPVVHDVPP